MALEGALHTHVHLRKAARRSFVHAHCHVDGNGLPLNRRERTWASDILEELEESPQFIESDRRRP